MFVRNILLVRLCLTQGIVRLGEIKGQFYKNVHV